MNWITDTSKFKSISKRDLLVVYAKIWSNRFSDGPCSYFVAKSDEDGDFDCIVTDNSLKAFAAIRILTPETKWTTAGASIPESPSGKYAVWGYEYANNTCLDKEAQRHYYVCEQKSFDVLSANYGKDGWYTLDNRRIWAFGVLPLPAIPVQHPIIKDLFEDLEHYYKVKLNGTPSQVSSPSGTRLVMRFDNEWYDISQPVKIKNKTISIAYKDQHEVE